MNETKNHSPCVSLFLSIFVKKVLQFCVINSTFSQRNDIPLFLETGHAWLPMIGDGMGGLCRAKLW